MASTTRYEVMWPLGPAEFQPPRPTRRISDLRGQTVGFLWNGLFKGDRMFAILKDYLSERFPGVRFVDWDAFGNIHGPDEDEIVAALPERLREHEVDAVVAAVGS